jgi:isopentenyldiphosphate isomerase
MIQEYLAVVDENDRVIGRAGWNEIRAKNLIHRGTAVLVFNSKRELFIHKRAKTIRRHPLHYALFVGGGVTVHESYKENAIRELEEEIGATNVKLNFLFKKFIVMPDSRFFVSIYSCIYDGELNLQPSEVDSGFYISFSDVDNLIEKEKFTPENLAMFNEYMKNYFHHDPAIKNI